MALCYTFQIINVEKSIQRMYGQQFYQKDKAKRNKRQAELESSRRNYILQAIVDLPDNLTVTLQSSIPLLKKLGVIEQINSIDHIVGIMENKKGTQIGWQTEGRLLWQCRLIYFMWHIIATEQIQVRDFKELIIMLSNSQENREELIQNTYGQNVEIAELIQTWDHLLRQSNQNSPNPKISSFRILKTKNQGCLGCSNMNTAEKHVSNSNVFNSFNRSTQKQRKNRVNQQKPYTKISDKTIFDRGNSIGRSNQKKNKLYTLENYIMPSQQINHFSGSATLSLHDQKKLLDRLYDCSKYHAREEIKQQIQRQKILCELNQCTFKPHINKTTAILKQPTEQIKGFEKAIGRMKHGYQKTIQLKENLQYRSSKQLSPVVNRLTQCFPPKFHQKVTKQQKPKLFQLRFSFGRISFPIKVREADNVDELADRISRIYSLKVHEKDYIRFNIIQTLQRYKEAIQQSLQHSES